MKRSELLLPAGNIEKLRYAIAYGADAVYFGITDFSLRSMKSGEVITIENIKNAIQAAHNMNAKAYVTANIFAHNEDIEKLPEFLEILQEEKPDGIIFSDPGVYSVLKRNVPDIPLHLSTQANTLNYESVKFWQDLGISRIILARELSLKEIEKISSKVPDIELEAFVHGSMCVSYSGRCLLSNYMTANERKSNQGGCVQPCRWKYKLVEETRPGQYFDIDEDDRGTYILNPKDLALIEYIPALIEAGVTAFKVEGRTKSVYYASIVAKTYKKAINAYYSGKKFDIDELMFELSQVGNRGFSSGFLIDKPNESHYDYKSSKGIAGATFLGLFLDKKEDRYKIQAKNQIRVGDEVDLITPSGHITTNIKKIQNFYNEDVQVANTNDIIYLSLPELSANMANKAHDDWRWGIIRRQDDLHSVG